MKKIFVAALVIVCIAIFCSMYVLYAAVIKSEASTPYDFNLKEGDRIIVIEAGAKTYIRVTPSDARQFDYKVPEGKKMSGQLIVH